MHSFSQIANVIVSSKEKKMKRKDEDRYSKKDMIKNKSNGNQCLLSSRGKSQRFYRGVIPRFSSAGIESRVQIESPCPDAFLDDNSSATTSTSNLTETIEKLVRFNKKCYVRNTTSRHNYTIQEIDACWFTDEEYCDIRDECMEKIQVLERGEELCSTDSCVRGLECRTMSALSIKQEIRFDAMCTVLYEQETGSSPERIAREYAHMSHMSKLRARHVGRKDEQEANTGFRSSIERKFDEK